MKDVSRPSEGDFLKEFLPAREDLLGFIFSLVPSHADAENIFQEASLVLWQRFSTYTPGTRFKAWARRIIYNKVLNERSRGRKELLWDPQVFEALDRAFESIDGSPDSVKAALEACLDTLPGINREILQTRYRDGRSYRDMAGRFQRSEQGIRVTVHKLRTFLADCVRHRLQVEA